MLSTTTMMMMATAVVLMTAQNNPVAQPWPTRSTLSSEQKILVEISQVISRNQQNQFQEFFFADTNLENTPYYHQLFVTDDEVKTACQAVQASDLIKEGGAFAPHPRTCFAHLVCSGQMFNPMRKDTAYLYNVNVRLTSQGTYYDPVTHRNQLWTLSNNCAADPCKTGRPMTVGLRCDTYITCERNAQNSPRYVEKKCPPGQGFSVNLNACADDPTCNPDGGARTEDVRCVATGRPADAPVRPGVPETAYYNHTFRFVDTGVEVTVPRMCSAGLIFNPNDEQSTTFCKCVLPPPVPCTPVTLIDVGMGRTVPWQNAINVRQYPVTFETQPPRQGWVRFQTDKDFSYYDAQGLAGNELAGKWTLNFVVEVDSNTPSTSIVLCENSYNRDACPQPSLRITVDLNSQTLRADVILKGPTSRTVSVTLQSPFARNQAMEVELERNGDNLILKSRRDGERNWQINSVGGMGRGPLVSTRCGLAFGKHYNGWLKSVSMMRNICN